jgi:Ni/Co efflux regulator RcnB
MKRLLSTAAVLSLALASMAQAATAESSEAKALRAECAAKNEVKFDAPAGDNEYRFVYSKGQYRGEARDGTAIDCSAKQYTQFLASADPVRVMEAYPTAAGRAKVGAKAASK